MPGGIDRRLLYNVDWVLAGAGIVLALVGVAMVYSATHSRLAKSEIKSEV